MSFRFPGLWFGFWEKAETGIVVTAMNPFTEKVASILPNQYHRHALEVDSHLRVLGAPLGTVYALGDAATVETHLVDHLLELVERCDVNHDGVIDPDEFEMMMKVRGLRLYLPPFLAFVVDLALCSSPPDRRPQVPDRADPRRQDPVRQHTSFFLESAYQLPHSSQ